MVPAIECNPESDCADNNKFLSGTSCYAVCPPGYEYSEEGSNLCISKGQCNAGSKYVYDTSCLSCNPIANEYFYAETSSCITKQQCNEMEKVVNDNACVQFCAPPNRYQGPGACYADICPTGYYNHAGEYQCMEEGEV